MMSVAKIEVPAKPPFRFDLSAAIFAGGDKQIRSYDEGVFRQVIRVDEKLIRIAVEAAGATAKPGLSVELASDRRITPEDGKKAGRIIKTLFNLDLDLAPFYAAVRDDKIMASLTLRLKGLRSPTAQTVFEALIDSIVEQQISLQVANALERRLAKAFGDSLALADGVYFSYPTPQKLAAASEKALRRCGLSRRKAEYVRGVSALVAEGKLDLEKLKRREDTEAIIRELDAVRGVGLWTAELTVIHSMQKWDAMPADDLGLRRVIARAYRRGRQIDSAEARRIARRWGPWKGLAAYYLIVAEMLGIEA